MKKTRTMTYRQLDQWMRAYYADMQEDTEGMFADLHDFASYLADDEEHPDHDLAVEWIRRRKQAKK